MSALRFYVDVHCLIIHCFPNNVGSHVEKQIAEFKCKMLDDHQRLRLRLRGWQKYTDWNVWKQILFVNYILLFGNIDKDWIPLCPLIHWCHPHTMYHHPFPEVGRRLLFIRSDSCLEPDYLSCIGKYHTVETEWKSWLSTQESVNLANFTEIFCLQLWCGLMSDKDEPDV